jgi:hypothetical protein
MKLKRLLLATLTAGALTGGSLTSNAQINFTVDPGQNWLGYVNVFDQADAFQFGFPENTPSTASANWAPGPAQPLTMSPNTRLYDENVLDPFWVDQGTFEATLVSEFNYYQETSGADPTEFVGQTANFYFDTVANDLPAGYEAVGFIKVLDGLSSWATYQIETKPLLPGVPTQISLVVNDSGVTGAGTPWVQAGFWVKGAYVSSSDPVALTGAQIVPEPTTFALAGLGAAALLIFRRRS